MTKTKKRGITIVEIIISLSVDFILITSTYVIIYWRLKLSSINEYYLDVKNIFIFVSNEVLNNPNLYLEYDNNQVILAQDA